MFPVSRASRSSQPGFVDRDGPLAHYTIPEETRSRWPDAVGLLLLELSHNICNFSEAERLREGDIL